VDLKYLFILLLSYSSLAFGSGGAPCSNFGWPGVLNSAGKCIELSEKVFPWQSLKKEKTFLCSKGEALCNPLIFGERKCVSNNDENGNQSCLDLAIKAGTPEPRKKKKKKKKKARKIIPGASVGMYLLISDIWVEELEYKPKEDIADAFATSLKSMQDHCSVLEKQKEQLGFCEQMREFAQQIDDHYVRLETGRAASPIENRRKGISMQEQTNPLSGAPEKLTGDVLKILQFMKGKKSSEVGEEVDPRVLDLVNGGEHSGLVNILAEFKRLDQSFTENTTQAFDFPNFCKLDCNIPQGKEIQELIPLIKKLFYSKKEVEKEKQKLYCFLLLLPKECLEADGRKFLKDEKFLKAGCLKK
jgi:hypothetical protein